MGFVLWHIMMSLDGFIAGVANAMDWVFQCPGPTTAVDEVIHTVGALVVARPSCDVGRREGQRDPHSTAVLDEQRLPLA